MYRQGSRGGPGGNSGEHHHSRARWRKSGPQVRPRGKVQEVGRENRTMSWKTKEVISIDFGMANRAEYC